MQCGSAVQSGYVVSWDAHRLVIVEQERDFIHGVGGVGGVDEVTIELDPGTVYNCRSSEDGGLQVGGDVCD